MAMTCLEDEGKIVLPESVIRHLGVRSGDAVDFEIEGSRVVITRVPPAVPGKARIIKDPVTGFPVLTMGPDSPIMTSRWVEEMLADFP